MRIAGFCVLRTQEGGEVTGETEAVLFLKQRGCRVEEMSGSVFMRDWRNSMHEFEVRQEFIRRFGFAILEESLIPAIARYSPLLEIGAGSGYWSYELRKAGVDIVPTDPGTGKYYIRDLTPAQAENWPEPWLEIERITGVQAVKKYPGRNLLMVWPDMANWPHKTLAAYTYRLAPPGAVLYVGESWGGCTANDRFHGLLERDFCPQATLDVPQFFGIHDQLHVWHQL